LTVRSLFWRIFASFWLAIALVAGLSMLLGRMFNQDAWILNQHPALHDLAETWTQRYEQQGPASAQALLEERRKLFRVNIQVFDESGLPLVKGTLPPRAAAFEEHRPGHKRLPWRRLSTDYSSPQSGETYLFIYRIPIPELAAWHRDSLLLPLSALGVAVLVLTLFSLWLTLSITRPLNHLRGAVHDLGQTSYQQSSLAQLAERRDELGVLASDFNLMGARLQDLIKSQRQLLRDVSHELRSPLARLRIALALSERAEAAEREKLWPRLNQECDRLEALISEILALARLDADLGPPQPIELANLMDKLQEDTRLTAPEQKLQINTSHHQPLHGWPSLLQSALDNLLRNALRFNPVGQPVQLDVREVDGELQISVSDNGPGVDAALLPRLGEPFLRAPGQSSPGHGLGLAIARRAAERHGGRLELHNRSGGGFCARLVLPFNPKRQARR
jgi:two-component system, OmpR family, sensor kinase